MALSEPRGRAVGPLHRRLTVHTPGGRRKRLEPGKGNGLAAIQANAIAPAVPGLLGPLVGLQSLNMPIDGGILDVGEQIHYRLFTGVADAIGNVLRPVQIGGQQLTADFLPQLLSFLLQGVAQGLALFGG